MADDKALESLADAVLDGDAIDWAAAESAAGASRPLVRGLQVVASVARLHRDVLPETVTGNVDRWGHLRLLERVGRGAWGEVFRAWDTRLDREVALKLLPAEPVSGAAETAVGASSLTLGDAQSIIREGQLLAKVRHPNVVTIHGAAQIDDCVGLWMEFIHGRTLETLLQHGAPFKPDEVMQIGVEVCRAVSAVHAAGLLHRDIKAHNVMRANDGRVVLMDFGTGRELADGVPGELAGTPLYLAPELLRQQPATVQSDVYSLGVLLYRLASGAYPVRGDSIAALLAAHERADRVPLRVAAPRINTRLARIIERAIDPAPKRRYATAEALGASLRSLQTQERRKPWWYAAAAIVVVAASSLAVWALRPELAAASSARGTEQSRRPEGVRPSVQVMPFTNTTGRSSDAWLSGVLAEMLLREFRGAERVRWIPGAGGPAEAQLGGALWPELHPVGVGGLVLVTDLSTTIRPVIPPDIVVSGEYRASGQPDWIEVVVRVEDKSGAHPPGVSTATGTTTELVELMSGLGARVRTALGFQPLTAAQQRMLLASQPANASAARYYIEALAKPLVESVPMLERSIAADPRFAAAHIRLAEALMQKRQHGKANAAAARALEVSSDWPREERLLIRIRSSFVAATHGSVAQTIATTRALFADLFRLFPDTVLYCVETIRGPRSGRQAVEALSFVDTIKRVPGAEDDVRILTREQALAREIQDYSRAQRALERIAAVATALDDRALLGATRHDQATLALELANHGQALSLAESAVLQLDGSEKWQLVPAARVTVARVVKRNGVEWAKSEYRRLIASARDRGDRIAEGALRYGLSAALLAAGQLMEAMSALDQVQRGLDVNERPYGAAVEVDIGTIQHRWGQFSAAGRQLETARLRADARGDEYLKTRVVGALAETRLAQGDVASALEYADQAVTMPGPAEWKVRARCVRALTRLTMGDVDLARAHLDEAAAQTAKIETTEDTQYYLSMAFALQALDEAGRAHDARGYAHRAVLLARTLRQPDAEAAAGAVLATAFLSEGDLAAAQNAVAPVVERLKVTEDRLLRLSAGVNVARVQAVSKEPAQVRLARRSLDALIREAADLGAVAIAFDARLALGEIEMRAGDSVAGRATLAALERDAADKGFVRIASRAAAARR